MGTRGLTKVTSGGKTKVAQYGQWDHYPEGQGVTILTFLKQFKGDYTPFIKRLKDVRFATKKDEKEVETFMKSIGVTDGWMDGDQAGKYHEKYPLLTRDNGAGVLQMIMDSKEKKMFLTDSSSFVDDGLFCEWWYHIDFDHNVFEVYNGPKSMVKFYKLDKLPDEKKFIKDCTPKD